MAVAADEAPLAACGRLRRRLCLFQRLLAHRPDCRERMRPLPGLHASQFAFCAPRPAITGRHGRGLHVPGGARRAEWVNGRGRGDLGRAHGCGGPICCDKGTWKVHIGRRSDPPLYDSPGSHHAAAHPANDSLSGLSGRDGPGGRYRVQAPLSGLSSDGTGRWGKRGSGGAALPKAMRASYNRGSRNAMQEPSVCAGRLP